MKSRFKEFISSKFGYTIIKKEFQPVGIDLQTDLIRYAPRQSFKTIMDVGANYGLESINFSKFFNNSNIYAFEPIQSTYETLEKNTSDYNRIATFNFALGEKIDEIEVYLHDDHQSNSLNSEVNIPRQDDGSLSEMVKVHTLDGFCDANKIDNIDLLKTDTEGLDIQVLKGGQKLLDKKKISFVFTEVGGFFEADKRHTNFFKIFDYLVREKKYHFIGLYDQIVWRDRKLINFANALFSR